MLSHKAQEFYNGKVVLVTGGGSGIGLEICYELAKADAYVILTARSELDENALKKLKPVKDNIEIQKLDVVDIKQFEKVSRYVVDKYRRIDILVNNAGISWFGDFSESESSSWKTVFNVNINGVLNGIHSVLPYMKQQGVGAILNISSGAGLYGVPGFSIYSTSKHAVTGITRSLAVELADDNIKVVSVCPGYVKTDLIKKKGTMTGGALGSKMGNIVYYGVAKHFAGILSVEKCAEKTLESMLGNQTTVVFPLNLKLIDMVHRVAPDFLINVVEANLFKLVRRKLKL